MSSGTVSIMALKDNDYYATEFPGTTAGLQAAIDYLAGGKGEVYIGPGTISITTPITIASGCHLRGSGVSATTLKFPDSYTGSNNDSIIKSSAAVTAVTIADLTIDGNRTNISTSNQLYAIRLIDAVRCEIRRVRCTEMKNNGIALVNSAASVTDCIVEECEVDNFGKAGQNGNFGILIQSTTNTMSNTRNVVKSCSIHDNTAGTNFYGITVESNYSRITGCLVQNAAPPTPSDDVQAYLLAKSTGSQITGCSADNIYGIAYSIQNGRVAGGDTTWINLCNSVTGNSANVVRFGIECSGASQFTATGNTFIGGVAIVAAGAAEGIEVNDDGLGGGDTMAGVSLTGNTLDSFQGNGIFVGSNAATIKDIVISGNTVRNTQKISLRLGSRLQHVAVNGNIFDTAGQVAHNTYQIVAVGSAGASKLNKYIALNGNVIRGATANPKSSYGIDIAEDSDFVVLNGNRIADTGKEGIRMVATVGREFHDTVIVGNAIHLSSTDAMTLAYHIRAVVGSNIIKNAGLQTGTYSGIAVDNSTKILIYGNHSFNDDVSSQDYGAALTGTSTGLFAMNDFTNNATGEASVPSTWRDVASAATLTLPVGVFFNVTGATGITAITASWPDRLVVLKFASTPTVTDGSNLIMNGNLVTTADDTLSLICDGTNWYEVARSAN